MPPEAEHHVSDGGGDSSGGDEQRTALSPKELAFFALHAARQNIVFCGFVAAVVAGIGITIVSALPRIYDSTCKVFVQEGGALTSALATGHDRARPAGDGTRGLQELLLAHDNLAAIVHEAHLFEKWPATRPWPMQIVDRLKDRFIGPPNRKDLERGFMEMLATSITGEEDGDSIRMHAQWRSAESAYDIANLTLRNFLAARASSDLGPIRRAIPFLEAQLQQADEAVESAVARVLTMQNQLSSPNGPTPAVAKDPAPASAPAHAAPRDPSLAEFATLSKELAAVRRDQRELVEPWRRRISELKAALTELSASYSPDHPLVRQQEARLAAASEVPSDLANLRARETELLSKLSARGGTRTPRVGATVEEEEAAAIAEARDTGESPELAPVKARLFAALRKADEIEARLESARIELVAGETDFNHRYVIIEQPEVPSKPFKSKRTLLFSLVMITAVLIGILAATVRELMRGRITESWQVRTLGLELLAEVELKRLPPQNKA